MYKVVLSKSAEKQYKRLPKRYKKSSIEVFKDLRVDPNIGKKLTRELKNRFTFPIGQYRIIYKVVKKQKRVDILSIKHRKHAYN